ncbi:flippase-like domain-containing protein [Parapedobacter sp. ISTM3]|uniref:lysylphosphatidylglycerol synthase transmembrane domain-containing protein n=1 Tax=Parapedobacter sp. ISTM3 TaxID=2800130 RepID=UPI00190822B9|nr:lysylphosphatidylglycerol synthase transmembrane domain-containing protein [Parapedobacter sp. ISTM3]MBK1440053.1 flippase-like domain-containing protein [Parapedobacter sp. ISTM3]
MNSKRYKMVFLLIGLATMGYMVYQLGLGVIWENIRKTGVWFIPIIGSWLVIYVMNALGFRAIISERGKRDTHLPFLRILRLTISGYAINYVTPFVALGGEPYRIMELKPALGTAKASSSVLLYSLMHMFSHIVFWLLSILLIIFLLPWNALLISCSVVILMIGGGLCIGFSKVYKKGFTMSILRQLGRWPLIGQRVNRFAIGQASVLQEIDRHIITLYSQRRASFYRSLAWEFAARIVGCAEIYFTAKAIGLGMSMGEALVVSSASSLFANVLFFFPMQLGTREGGLALALQAVGMAGSAGIFIGIVTRIREIIWIFIGLALMGPTKKMSKVPALALADNSINEK